MAVVPLEEEADGQKIALLRRLKSILDEISREERIEKRDILEMLKESKDISVPLGVFTHRQLGILEAVVKYLKEEKKKTITEIAAVLKRDKRTIWSTYDSAREKLTGKMDVSGDMVPLSIFSNRKLGALECLSAHLHSKGMRYSEIGRLLNRDQRNIWVLYNRSLAKLKGKIMPIYSDIMVPISIFQDRQMGTLLAVVTYLKEKEGMRFADIARLLARDPKMVCAVYHQGHRS
mgnify:CR=1 FL=1